MAKLSKQDLDELVAREFPGRHLVDLDDDPQSDASDDGPQEDEAVDFETLAEKYLRKPLSDAVDRPKKSKRLSKRSQLVVTETSNASRRHSGPSRRAVAVSESGKVVAFEG